jgi:hypothetical protein
VRLKKRKTFLDGWGVVDADGNALITDDNGKPVLFRVPELAVAEGNKRFPGQAWSVRWVK